MSALVLHWKCLAKAVVSLNIFFVFSSVPAFADTTLTKPVFDRMLAEFAAAMTHRTEPFTHRRLTMQGLWDERKVQNASVGANFSIEITGGLALHPQMTSDAIALALCHEVGHLAGVRSFENPQEREFNADHFAASYCFPRLLAASPTFRERGDASSPSPEVVKLCQSADLASLGSSLEVCIRAHKGALGASLWSYGHLTNDAQGTFKDMQIPDFGRTARNRFDFAQCRLQSFSAGALNDFNSDTVPQCARQ